jgi:DNA-binding transcriptional regulator YdaS (Cro superfamily)
MALENAHTRTLRRALKVAGSAEALARALEVAPSELAAWMRGAVPLPTDVYLRALDLVASGVIRRPTSR